MCVKIQNYPYVKSLRIQVVNQNSSEAQLPTPFILRVHKYEAAL